jgi:hypothetical protein
MRPSIAAAKITTPSTARKSAMVPLSGTGRERNVDKTPPGVNDASTTRQRVELGLAGLAGLALAGWEGEQPWPTAAAHWGIAAAIVLTATAAVALGRGRQQMATGAWLRSSRSGVRASPALFQLGIVVWIVLVAAAIGWDLTSFLAQSHQLPTFSSLTGRVTHHPAGRAVLVGAWLALGGYLSLGRRR